MSDIKAEFRSEFENKMYDSLMKFAEIEGHYNRFGVYPDWYIKQQNEALKDPNLKIDWDYNKK